MSTSGGDVNATRSPGPAGAALSGAASTGPATRVLVCDDEPGIVELLKVSLTFQGFEVATAADGSLWWPPRARSARTWWCWT